MKLMPSLPALSLILVCGCTSVVKRELIRHPAIYEQKGRPAWTYDENRLFDDLSNDERLPELSNPENYQFFLGIQSVALATQEAARRGALINATSNYKTFLRTVGLGQVMERLGGGLRTTDQRYFSSQLNDIIDAPAYQLKPVRWYIEEERVHLSNGDTRSEWKVWCLGAASKAKCDEIYSMLLDKDKKGEPLSGSSGESSVLLYTVKKGDSLWVIARNHGISIKELRRANGLTGDILEVGQLLRIPK